MVLGPLGNPTCDVPMWNPRLLSTWPSLLGRSVPAGSATPLPLNNWADCSPTMIVFDVPSVTLVSAIPRPRVRTPPSETGPRNCELEVSVEGCVSAPRMQVYDGRQYPSSPDPLLAVNSGIGLDGHRMSENTMPFQMFLFGCPPAPPNQNVCRAKTICL